MVVLLGSQSAASSPRTPWWRTPSAAASPSRLCAFRLGAWVPGAGSSTTRGGPRRAPACFRVPPQPARRARTGEMDGPGLRRLPPDRRRSSSPPSRGPFGAARLDATQAALGAKLTSAPLSDPGTPPRAAQTPLAWIFDWRPLDTELPAEPLPSSRPENTTRNGISLFGCPMRQTTHQ